MPIVVVHQLGTSKKRSWDFEQLRDPSLVYWSILECLGEIEVMCPPCSPPVGVIARRIMCDISLPLPPWRARARCPLVRRVARLRRPGYCGCRSRVEWASLDMDNFLGRLWCRSCMAAHDTSMFFLVVGISLTEPGHLSQALPLERGICGQFLCCRGIPCHAGWFSRAPDEPRVLRPPPGYTPY